MKGRACSVNGRRSLRLPIRRHQFILIALSASAGGWGGWFLAHSGLAVFVGIVLGIGGGALASLVVGDRKLLADSAANGPDAEAARRVSDRGSGM